MKKVLLLAAALCLSVFSFAQVQVATLQHGDSIRVFYYSNAFLDAYNAAVPGDVISLSAGTFSTCAFSTCSINKDSLTIRGAGMDQTFFEGGVRLGVSSGTDYIHTITMEGIYCGSTVHQYADVEVHFTNVYFDNFSNSNNNALSGQFVNCRLASYSAGSNCTPMLINCIVGSLQRNSGSCFVNCIVRDNIWDELTNTSFINSILVYYHSSHDGYRALPQNALAQNCIGVDESSLRLNSIFSSCVNQNSVIAPTSIFPNFSLDYSSPERYVLTDSAQAAYLGTDGTQVGLYGGYCPWSSSLPYPVISRMNVARQTTADGRLSVDIQVGYRQESDEDNE